jgi:hypothetical protein
MAGTTKPKGKRTIKGKRKPTIIKVRRKIPRSGASVLDLVGTIELTVDPVEYQRAVRDEWE